jgi:hypothetical protein
MLPSASLVVGGGRLSIAVMDANARDRLNSPRNSRTTAAERRWRLRRCNR